LVEDFETLQGHSGGVACAFDHNGLGTHVSPDPFELTAGGAPVSPGHSARYYGAIGDNRAPYSWAQLQLSLNPDKSPKDLREFRSIRFWAKGDGARYSVVLVKKAVSDHDHFKQEFVAGKEWTQVELPISGFVQAGWGKKLPTVFEDVEQIQFSPAAYARPFDLSVDHVELGRDEVVLSPFTYDTRDWFAYRGTDPVKRRGTALDVSRLLDAPAGKYGTVVRRGENFAFANGKPIRFWGVNLVASANFPTHAEADRLAELLAQLGVNMTRHHHMDSPQAKPNVFGNAETTRALDPDVLERFDYFVAALQKRGIYQFFDLLVKRKLGADDDVPARADVVPGFKIEGEFAPRLIELQEKFVEQLMGHRNPYTKRTYANDPAVALVEIINEDSLFWIQQQGEFAIESAEYRKLLGQQFSAWLSQQVPGGRAGLEKRWQPGAASGQGLAESEDPAQGNVDALVMFATDDAQRLRSARAADTMRFYFDTTLAYYRRMHAKLKSLGYRGLITGSNHWLETPIDLYANSRLDFVDRHAYWSHPNGGWGYSSSISWNPDSMLRDTGLGVVGSLATRRVKGLPYTASEWQTSAPNDYREEGVLVVGAYAALANFSPLEFAFSHESSKRPDQVDRMSNNFDLIEQPSMLGAWPAVSLLFHRHDVAESKQDAVLKIDEASVFSPTFHGGLPKELARLGKTGVGFGEGQSLDQLQRLSSIEIKDGVARADGGELIHDATRGTLLIDTARSQAFAGFKPEPPIKLTNLQLSLESAFAVVIVTALDDQPIAASKRILVSALGNAINSGMTLGPGRNRLENAGAPPVLVEPIVGRLALLGLRGKERSTVYALGPNGERDHQVQASGNGDGLSFGLSSQHRTLHYEIVRE
jgi:complex I intermediate-associated protein 30 (CIA30)